MSKVDEALAEIEAALAAMAPAHEGLRDFALLNLQDDTKTYVNDGIGQYDRRKGLLGNAKIHLEKLITDTYPTLRLPDASISVKADLSQNVGTIGAAFSEVTSEPAVSLGMTASEPETK